MREVGSDSPRAGRFLGLRYHCGVRIGAVVGLVVVTAVVSFWAGTRVSSDADAPRASRARASDESAARSSADVAFDDDDDDSVARRAAPPAESPIETRDRARRRQQADKSAGPSSPRPTPGGSESCDAETVHALEACAEEQLELLGRPIPSPPAIAERFEGRALSGQVGRALEQAGVAGEVEATDCSEHPCIVFGRLEGDEADIEKVERAEVLEPYDADILTLLFWATTSDDPAAPAQETGLFALAYYEDADRQEHGEDLERRIRARVMEYWNTDRPGPAGAAP